MPQSDGCRVPAPGVAVKRSIYASIGLVALGDFPAKAWACQRPAFPVTPGQVLKESRSLWPGILEEEHPGVPESREGHKTAIENTLSWVF
jgi:hypothetical protein